MFADANRVISTLENGCQLDGAKQFVRIIQINLFKQVMTALFKFQLVSRLL